MLKVRPGGCREEISRKISTQRKLHVQRIEPGENMIRLEEQYLLANYRNQII